MTIYAFKIYRLARLRFECEYVTVKNKIISWNKTGRSKWCLDMLMLYKVVMS